MEHNPLTPEEVACWAEWGCWIALSLTPFLYWVNGPAVSADQFVVRTILVVLALGMGIVLRLTKLMRKGRR